ncbi:MAG: peptidoglycan editing factor PgeF [Candidatus Omnitrophota bacterium]
MPPKEKLNRQKILGRLQNFFGKDVFVFVSERPVDFSLAKSAPLFSSQQKNLFKRRGSLKFSRVLNIRQIHGCRILCVTGENDWPQRKIRRADGLMTCASHIPLAVRIADCLSIFMFDPKTKTIALVHAGWRGSRKQIAKKAVLLMKRKFGARAENLKITFGPCIRSCCYQVSVPFKNYFPREVKKRNNQYYLDLPLVNKNQLIQAGVEKRNIFDSRLCTFCDQHFFSFRRQGKKAGRMISLIMRKSS